MSGQQNESISALMDGEASEIEIHRLLRDLEKTEAMKRRFFTFQSIRQVIRSPSSGQVSLDVERHMVLFNRISAAVSEEPCHDLAAPVKRRWTRPVAGFAVAASLLVAIGVGVNLSQEQVAGTVADQQPALQPDSRSPAVNTRPVSTAVAGADTPSGLAPGVPSDLYQLKEPDEANLKVLREYLNRHDRARLGSDQQLVTYPKPAR